MKILRLFIGNKNCACASIYENEKLISERCFDSTKKLAKSLDKDLENIDCIYVFRGPGGFSRLRALGALARGIALGKEIPLSGYVSWQAKKAGIIARHNPKSILY